MAKLKPAFDKEGTVTAGNASGINDGAAAVVLMSESEAEARHHAARPHRLLGALPASIRRSWAPARSRLREGAEKAGWTVGDLDLVEANEAFAAQACAVNKDMGWDPSIVNVNGGAIAIGHPIGASGARVFNTLLTR
jgi:acetyl-CoA C-acetyltransferase